MSALDWIGRIAVLVLSTLATLAIIGSLVSVSAPPAAPPPSADDEAVTIEVAPERLAASQSVPAAPARIDDQATTARIAAAPPEREIARWLEALTYAVLGLAGFVAVLAIVAMRATAHLGALADRR